MLTDTLDPAAFDDCWIDWNPVALREEIERKCEYLVDKGAITEYTVGTVIGGYEPSVDLSIVPVRSVDPIKLHASVSRQSAESEDILGIF